MSRDFDFSSMDCFFFFQVSLLFEVEDLAVASPATVSRCGMVFSDYKDLGWQPYVDCWLDKRTDKVRVFLYLRLANCLFVFILLCTGRLYYSILCPRHLKRKTSGSISEIPTKIVGSTKTNL